MRHLPVNVWREFQSAVSLLNETSSARDTLDVILLWIRGNRKYFLNEPFSTYGFEDFVDLKEKEMPVDFSSFLSADIDNFKKFTYKYQAKDVNAIAQLLRDVIEALITVDADRQCPRCDSEGMHVFIGKQNGLLAYQCNTCGYSHYSDGTRVGLGGLGFVTEKKLREFNMI